MPKSRFQAKSEFPRKQRFFEFPATFGDISGPGIPGAWPSIDGLKTGHAGHEAGEVGYLDSHLLQNPLRGVAVRAPVGSLTKVSYGFRNGPTGTSEQTVENSGIYSPSANQVGVVAGGSEEINVSGATTTFKHTIGVKDGEANPVVIDRAGSTARLQTLQDDDGIIALTKNIPAGYTDEQAQDAVGGMVDASLTYVDATPLLQRAALTGDVTASAGSNATTIANDAVTNAKAANMADSTIKGRAAGAGTGDPTDLTATQATAILNTMVGDSGAGGTKGLVPAPVAGDAVKFLRGDGTFAAPTATAAIAVQEEDVDVDAACDTLDFAGADFNLSSEAGNEVRVTVNRGASGVQGLDANSAISGLKAVLTVEAHTTNDTLTAAESASVHTNGAATGTVILTLPTAAAGLNFHFSVAATQILRITAGASDNIRVGGSVSADAGSIEASTIGHSVFMYAINDTRWVCESGTGTWAVT